MAWSSSRDGRGPAPPAPLRMWADDGWLAIAAPLLIFAGHALYGAMLPQTALVLSLAAALMLGLCLLRPRLRTGLQRLDGLALPALLFAFVILAALWSLTPLIPGGTHPVWSYLGIAPGAATIDRGATLLEIFKLLGLACVFLLGAAIGGSDARARLAVNTTLVLGVLLAAWAFLSFVSSNHLIGSDRMEASFQSANTAGTVFAVLFLVSFGPMASRLNGPPAQRLTGISIYGAAALIFLTCVFATASRGAFAASGAGLLALTLLLVFGGRLRWSRAVLTGAIVAVSVFLLLAFAGEMLLNRLLGATQEFGSRAYIFKIHWQAFLASPLFGYGLGTFDIVNRMLLDAETFPQIWAVRAAHNIYLAWLEQAGLIGALPMFACIGLLVLATVRKAFRRNRMTSVLFALAGADAVYIAHGASDFALEMFSVAAMWALLLGLQFGLSQGSSTR